jgi:predicted metalloprotease with PDZ domain
VSQVRRGTPAHDAGLNVDDEIVGVDDYRVRVDQLDDRLQQYRPGDEVTLLVARRDALLRLRVVLGVEPPSAWHLERRPDITADQRARLDAWLTGPRGAGSAADQAAPPEDESVEPGLHEAR